MFLKNLFRKTSVKTLSRNNKAAIVRGAILMRSGESSSDDTLVKQLVNEGTPPELAARIVIFLPMAYCRVMLATSGVHFPPTYIKQASDGTRSPELPLDSEPIWNELITFAQLDMSQSTAPQRIAIAGRSAEFSVINDLLNSDSKLEDIHLTSTIVMLHASEE